MKKIIIKIIFTFGIIFEAIAFLLSNADCLPFVYRIISPAYVEGISAIKILENTGELKSGSSGFKVCADIYMESFRHDYPNFDLTGISIERLYHPPLECLFF